MSHRNRVIVGLLSHYYQDDNLGCVALSVSNVILLDQAAAQLGVDIEYRILVNEKHPHLPLSFTTAPHEYRTYSSAKQTVRHPLRLLASTVFDDCDMVMNINAGDGFTDLYGFPRMLAESYMSLLALKKRIPLVIAPQTIGPFERRSSKRIAAAILRRSEHVFTRDQQSTALSAALAPSKHPTEVIDVAFALPFSKTDHGKSSTPRIGLNVSGLLYRGGYNGKNYFDLAIDYRRFVDSLIERLLELEFEVHLIPHVIAHHTDVEDDYSASVLVNERYPRTILAPRFDDAIAAKSYIAGMDFFTGARMHSTIAAISSGVPVAPIGYSKKLGGLYDTLGYPYYIDARDRKWTTDLAIAQLTTWIDERQTLKEAVDTTKATYEPRLQKYRDAMSQLFTEALNRKD